MLRTDFMPRSHNAALQERQCRFANHSGILSPKHSPAPRRSLYTYARCRMIVGNRVRAIREQKKLCQVDLAVRAGLLQSYLSKVEDCDAVPDVHTLDKIATALEVPLHKLFYDGDEAPPLPNLPDRRAVA